MSNPFDYVNSISQSKKNLIVDEQSEKEYVPFLTNRSLSYHMDCLAGANEMNRLHFIDKKMQYDYLLNSIRSKRRPAVKWAKTQKNDELDCIKKIYNLSDSKALDVYHLLSKEEIQQLKEKTDIGGLRK
jgi:NADH:ubiquinone oxidoreductase subunit C